MSNRILKSIEIGLIGIAVLCLLFAWFRVWTWKGPQLGPHVRGPLAKHEYYKLGDIDGYLAGEFRDIIEARTPREAFSRGLTDNLELAVSEGMLTRIQVDELLALTTPQSSSADLNEASRILLSYQEEALEELRAGIETPQPQAVIEGYVEADFAERTYETGPEPVAEWVKTTLKGALVEGCLPEDLYDHLRRKATATMLHAIAQRARASAGAAVAARINKLRLDQWDWERARIREIEKLRTLARMREFILVQTALEFEGSPAGIPLDMEELIAPGDPSGPESPSSATD